jgi:hypothetical protein
MDRIDGLETALIIVRSHLQAGYFNSIYESVLPLVAERLDCEIFSLKEGCPFKNDDKFEDEFEVLYKLKQP